MFGALKTLTRLQADRHTAVRSVTRLCISGWLQGTALVRQAFRLLETAKQRQHPVPCVLFENVRHLLLHPLVQPCLSGCLQT